MNASPSPQAFNMFSGLIWDNVREIVNYDNGIAFHNVLAEPDGNKAYIEAVREYPPIQIMTAQTEAEKLLKHFVNRLKPSYAKQALLQRLK